MHHQTLELKENSALWVTSVEKLNNGDKALIRIKKTKIDEFTLKIELINAR